MKRVELKLKQASAVLGVPPKDLQNMVQLKVLRPRFRDNLYWFDTSLLLQAKIAFYLRDALGTSSGLLGRFTEAVPRCLRAGDTTQSQYVSLRSRPATGKDADQDSTAVVGKRPGRTTSPGIGLQGSPPRSETSRMEA